MQKGAARMPTARNQPEAQPATDPARSKEAEPTQESIRTGLWWCALLLLVAAIGVLDLKTGPRVSFALFYAIPITIAAWYLGGAAALVTSVAAGLGLYFGDLSLRADALSPAYLWNTAIRLFFLIAVGGFTVRVRNDQQRLRALLQTETSARMATVEQLRHRDRLALVGQVASGIAHEVGTPLSVIVGRARLITESDSTLEESRQHAVRIIEQSERVTTTIRQLLDFARRRGPQREEVNLYDLLRRTVDLLSPLASKRHVALRLERSETQSLAQVDATQIEQALGNLIMNAVQSIRDHGEVRVRVQTAHRAPENAAAKTSDPYLVLIVEDNGIGIAKDSLQRIFEPFFTTQRAGEGTGLGLSITSEIIADHGGFIEVESEPWKGSRFAVYLPKGKLE